MTKQEDRKARIDEFLDWLETKDGQEEMDRLVPEYSYKSGISPRTLKEYVEALTGAKIINHVKLPPDEKHRYGSWKRVIDRSPSP